MSFFNSIHTFGTIETTRSYSYAKNLNPVERRRSNFVRNAKNQIAMLRGGAELPLNSWISRLTIAGVVKHKVSLRMGPKLLPLPGGTHLVIEQEDKVVEFLEGVVGACEEGELDELLATTAQKPKATQQIS